MSRVRVKICGNTSKEDVAHAVQAGADAVGFIIGFPSTPRNLKIDQAYILMKNIPPFIDTVVVTRQDNPKLLKIISEKLHMDAVQLIGETPFTPDLRNLFPEAHLIKVIHMDPARFLKTAYEASMLYDAILIDSKVNDVLGGTGQVHDWTISHKAVNIIKPTPTILAGGLTPSNVEDAIKTVQPYAIDVSSGVESAPGVKDPHKVESFVDNAKRVKI